MHSRKQYQNFDCFIKLLQKVYCVTQFMVQGWLHSYKKTLNSILSDCICIKPSRTCTDKLMFWCFKRILFYITLFSDYSAIEMLFSEELGLILEVPYSESTNVLAEYSSQNVPCFLIGHSYKTSIPSESMVIKEWIFSCLNKINIYTCTQHMNWI